MDAEALLEKELDIIHLVRKLRKLEALFKVLLSKHERQLLLFIKSNVLGPHKKKGKEKILP